MTARYLTPALVLLSQISAANAQLSLQQLRDFAKDMCATPPITSTNDQTRLTGEATAKLGNFLSKLADLGVTGDATIKREATSGVLQKDLADAIKNGNDCHVAIVTTIVNKSGISSQPPQAAPAADGIRQGGIEVGKVFGGRRSPGNAMVYEFVEITHANRLDRGSPFEFDGVVLRMVRVETVTGLDMSRAEDGMVYSGVTAQVIGQVHP